MMPDAGISLIVRAARFAAERHSGQTRKGTDVAYINHTLEVAQLLSDVAGVTDAEVLAAALLHDTVEDSETTLAELRQSFGARVADLVDEMSDDPDLSPEDQKRRQVEEAPDLSRAARTIKIADKISNLRDVTAHPPPGWSVERSRRYIEWTSEVVAGCRGVSPELEQLYDRTLEAARRSVV